MKKYILLMFLVSCGGTVVEGPPGPPGNQGDSGNNGHSVVFFPTNAPQCLNGGTLWLSATDTNDNGILDVTDDNIKYAVVCNGQNAPWSLYITVGIITPCGPNSSPYKEVLLLLANGSVLASFSDNVSGTNTRFALIPDGSYQDTDASACPFTLSTSGTTRTISWSGGGQSWTVSN